MRNDQRENLLNDALASYSRQEPRPGLERRVLDRIHAPAAHRLAFPRWAWAVPAVTCMLWASILWTRHLAPPKRAAVTPVAHMAAVQETAPPSPATPPIVERPRKRKVLPRLPQFPAPAPITNEERALLAFVTRAPKEAQQALIAAPQRSIEPIRIEEIKIEPLP